MQVSESYDHTKVKRGRPDNILISTHRVLLLLLFL